jgi:hypothetical protein
MQTRLFIQLLLVSLSMAQAQVTETITKSQTIIIPSDFANTVPQYFIPDGTVITLSRNNGYSVKAYYSRESFFSASTSAELLSLQSADALMSTLYPSETVNNSVYIGPLYLRIIPQPSASQTIAIRVNTQEGVSGQTNTPTVNPSTAVVIPSTVTGDVEVVLEQSQDGVTWTQCLPGTYNASTVKRFFRLRAVEK